jgi:hypothetical protein
MHERQSAMQSPEPLRSPAQQPAETSEAAAVAVATVDETDAASGFDTDDENDEDRSAY